MPGKLVIVESPSKAKTINKILGREYLVKSSVGHIRDLPVHKFGVDIKNSFKPEYVIINGKKKVIDELKAAVKISDIIYLAPDPDREGEAIAWHLKEILSKNNKSKEFFRVQYNEVTSRAVKKAFENPGQIDVNRVNAQQARRILDRIVGYKVSPVLWRHINRGLSAGRVQSVALRLVCEREEEIQKFVPEKYWIIEAKVCKLIPPRDPFKIKLMRINNEKSDIKKKEDAGKIKTELERSSLKVKSVNTRTIFKKPSPPYITSTLQQAGSSYCGFSPKRTMSIAQKLYEGIDLGDGPVGLITYMRTDSFAIAQDALTTCRDLIKTQFGEEYLPEKPNYYKSRASAQEAHEAIRPTHVLRTPETIKSKLDPSAYKLYKLIWQRFVACQMSSAKIEQRIVKVEALPQTEQKTVYLFHASASEIKFPGYMKVSGKEKKKDDEVEFLPPLKEGEELECLEWIDEEKQTKPPPRYSESSLVKDLEKNGVGRPSTYAQILSTLHNRDYVKNEKRILIPTQLGIQVNDLLVKTLDDLFDVKFTANMEESLDNIEKGNIEWIKMLEDFYNQFEKWMINTEIPSADKDYVLQILDVLTKVKTWTSPVKIGKKHSFSDERFVNSVRKQFQKGEKEISLKQLEALIKVGVHYKNQVQEIETVIRKIGYSDMLKSPELQPPVKTTLKKLKLLKEVIIDESTRNFIDSLQGRVDRGRCLSEAQRKALNNIVASHASQIKDYENIKHSLDIIDTDVEEDNESDPLLGALSHVKDWKEPVTRRKKVFDDKVFYSSLSEQYSRKGFLSIKQREALKKIIRRYGDQIPDYEEIAEKFGLEKKGNM